MSAKELIGVAVLAVLLLSVAVCIDRLSGDAAARDRRQTQRMTTLCAAAPERGTDSAVLCDEKEMKRYRTK